MTIKDKQNLINAAHAGGTILRKYFGKTLNIIEKSTVFDFQTEADLGSEKAILKILKKEFPTYNIHSEEAGKTDKNSEYTLVIDPLDGTNNFVMGIPNFSVSIAILYNDKPVAGVIYQPILHQTYYAEKNKGAWLNNKKIKVNNVSDKNKITITYTCGYKRERTIIANVIQNLILAPHKRIALNWSPANDYCLLASGKLESIISDTGMELYDYAAGKLIAQEAGAKIIHMDGEKETSYVNGSFIMSNRNDINKYVWEIIKSVR